MYNSLKHTFFTSHSLSIITELHPLKQSESSQLNRVGRFHFKRKFCKTLFGTLLTENIETDSHWPIYVILRKDMRFLNWISYFNQKNLFLINITGLYQPHTHTHTKTHLVSFMTQSLCLCYNLRKSRKYIEYSRVTWKSFIDILFKEVSNR